MENKKVYVLEIVDTDEGFVYDTLVFENERERNIAKLVVSDFDHNWYVVKNDDYRATHNYEEELKKYLHENIIDEYFNIDVDSIEVR
jgi:hypothetical protein